MSSFFRYFFTTIVCLVISLQSATCGACDIRLGLRQISDIGKIAIDIKLSDGYKIAKTPKVWKLVGFDEIACESRLEQNYKDSVLYCDLNEQEHHSLKLQFFVCKDICEIITKEFEYRPKTNGATYYLLLMLLFGFLGGALLNIMPCVLPVIMLKLKHLTSKEAILGSIVGNYLTFVLMAFGICVLKFFGNQVGWGLHFQNLYFLKAACIDIFVLSLIGFEKIHFGISLEINQNHRGEILKNVISSGITTLLAIPCSAPLLGSAAAFAIQESFGNLLLIFVAIATGFNMPYFLCSFLDVSFLRKLQGRAVQKIINAGIILTLGWLMWQLFLRIKFVEYLLIIILFVFSLALFVAKRARIAWIPLIIIMFVGASNGRVSQQFDFNKISEKVNQNHVVILSITADWCVSCKYNKLKFSADEVRKKLKDCNAEFIEIDITEPDDRVLQYIKNYGRSGIPFTIVFGAKNKRGILLSELPSVDEILLTIDKVK